MRKQFLKALRVALILSLLVGVFTLGGVASASEREQQSQFVAPVLVVNTSFLNIRTGPGVQFTVLITVVGGTQLPALGVAPDGVWYQVSTVAGVGWVNVEFTLPRGDFSRVPVVDLSAAEVIVGGGGTGTSTGAPVTGTTPGQPAPVSRVGTSRVSLTVDAANVLTQPAEGSPTIGTIFRDDTKLYRVVGATTDRNGLQWFQIEVPDMGVGWIDAGKVVFRASEDDGRTVVTVIVDVVAMVDAPNGNNNGLLPILSYGQEAYLIDVSQDANFFKIELFGGGPQGWVPVSTVQIREPLVSEEDQVNSSAGGGGAAVPGQPGVVQPAPAQPGLAAPRIVVNTAFLNVRSGPGAQYSVVATVPGGTELPVLGVASDNVWFLVSGTFGVGWMNIEFGLFRGDISVVPVIRETSGVLATPTAAIAGTITLYAAPSPNFGVVGTVTGPLDVAVVARTADFAWVQLNTPIGFGWVPASSVTLRGDTSLIPVVG